MHNTNTLPDTFARSANRIVSSNGKCWPRLLDRNWMDIQHNRNREALLAYLTRCSIMVAYAFVVLFTLWHTNTDMVEYSRHVFPIAYAIFSHSHALFSCMDMLPRTSRRSHARSYLLCSRVRVCVCVCVSDALVNHKQTRKTAHTHAHKRQCTKWPH